MKSDNKGNLFDTSHLQTDLKRRSLRSGAVTLASHWVRFILMLGSTMVLARLLTPEDYGTMAMVVAINGFAGLFLNLGLSTATIQKADITHAQVSTLFWINAGVGFILMIVVASLSPLIAKFYQAPELLWVALVMSTIFFMNGLAVQHQALLNRQMRFFDIAVMQIASTLIGILIAVYFAFEGYGYWALALNRLTETFFFVAGTWFFAKWTPGLPRRVAGVGSMLKFGSNLVGFDVVNYFSRNLDKILLGRFYGNESLGLYSKAYQLLMLPIENLLNPLKRVAMPALSRLRNEPDSYRIYYMKFISILAFVTMPLVAFLFVCSDQIINIILGQQWGETSELFKILALVAFIQPVASTRGVVLVTTGKGKRYLILGISFSIIISASFVVGLPWGAKGVATCYTIANYILLIPSLFYAFKDTPVRVGDFLIAVYKPFTASMFMGIAGFLTLISIPDLQDISIVAFIFVISLITYILALIFVSWGLKDIREYYNYGRIVFAKNK